MLSAETPDLIKLDVGILGLRHRGAGDPPVRTGKPGGQIGSRPRLSMLLGAAGVRDNFAVCRLPQPDKASLFAEDDSVVPPPDHRLGAVGRGRDSYKVTG